MPELTPTDLAILDLERTRWKHLGAKQSVALERLGLSPTRYSAALNRLLDRPEVEAADPVRRLRRLRGLREGRRAGRRAGRFLRQA